MKRYGKISLIALLVVCVLLALASLGSAQVDDQPQAAAYSIDTWTAGAGGMSSGGGFTLSGSAGQQDAGPLSGGSFTLDGGFWRQAVTAVRHFIYLPALFQNAPGGQ